MATRPAPIISAQATAGELTPAALLQQNALFIGSGGASEGNRSLGFLPAFYDMDTGGVYPSRFANGLQAPMHLLDGLPEDLVVARQEDGRVTAVKPGVVAGFLRHGQFFTRQQAAQATERMRDRSHLLSNPEMHDRLLSTWEQFLLEQTYPRELIRPVVEDSWYRCQSSKVDPELQQAPVLAQEQLELRRASQSDLRTAAKPVLERAGSLLFESDSLVLLADTEGLILDIAGDPPACGTGHKVNLIEGAHWGEASIGTNAIGTALTAAEPVQLYGAEHFCAGIKHWTCSADLIRDPHDGRVLGVLDLSGLTDSYQRHALDFAMTAARMIEANLQELYFRCREQVIEATRDRFRNWRGPGLLAFDRRGRLVKANALAHRALQMIGADLELTPQTRLPELDLAAPATAADTPNWLNALQQQPIMLGRHRVGTLLILSGSE
ncbi:sigma-54-dependent Fis family transcriptional regulator [Marinobacterium arenosum]|uniref:sigma-54-dependent Fis family transcriptional regulator n=1 Tax=Marinobacterium arenosum TaxID=2862496 RepID=UPI001C96656B|nr:GAF domain-containing protein [Marinobacterium arenosum]MBY4675333.1 GAF domain-containing protein [Marinobacterium arenosum]